MIQYFETNGQPGDEWLTEKKWHEKNVTNQEFHNMTIYEPCNYASNVAYYHVATQICQHKDLFDMPPDYVKGLVQGFVTLAMGSAFFHASETQLGSSMDTHMIDVVSYLAYQAMVENLPTNTSVIKELSLTPRRKSGIQETQDLMNMFTSKPVEEWEAQIRSMDMPNFFISFSGLIGPMILMRFDVVTADLLIFGLMDLLDVPAKDKEFVTHYFLPEIKNATAHINLTDEQKYELEGNLMSFAIKILYAFLWQEEFLTQNPIIYNPIVNVIGNTLIKYVNGYANSINTFPIYEQAMQDGERVYPGSEWCNPLQTHAKWHLESANGLLDLVYLSDYVRKLINM